MAAGTSSDGRGMRLGLLVHADGGRDGTAPAMGDWVGLAAVAERVGFDSLWVEEPEDAPGEPASEPKEPGPRGGWHYEAFTVLGALATRTSTLHLGALPGGGEQRSPAILARLVTGVDVISHGRSLLAHRDDSGDEIALDERLQVSRAVLEQPRPVFHGRDIAIDGAVNLPRPVQAGGVPIVVFVRRVDDAALRAAGRYADGVVLGGGQAAWRDAAQVVVDEAARADRSPGSVALLWRTDVRTDAPGETSSLADEVAERVAAGASGCVVAVTLGGRTGLDALGETVESVGGTVGRVLPRIP